MTWRAFVIGLLAVALIAAAAPYNDFDVGNTYLTGCHFPPGPFFLLLLLTVGANVLIKLVRRHWALRQTELMLIWCMMLVSSTVPSSGLMRFLFSLPAAPAYYATAPDLPNQKRVLEEVPEGLVLTKDPRSVAARSFFEGPRSGERVRLYLGLWARPLLRWGLFLGLLYLATFFLGGILRKQWVEVERLIFPLARVPLELTEGSGEARLLPNLVRNKAFLVGAAMTLVFAFVRAVPVMLGKEQGWLPTMPLGAILSDTPLRQTEFLGGYFFPIAVGIAFLVPADVTLSIWFFFIFTRVELQAAHWMGIASGGSWGEPMQWQQFGAFVMLGLMTMWSARRHLITVARKALGLGAGIDDSAEPIPYKVGFWGFVLSVGGMAAWFAYYGMSVVTAVAYISLILCIALMHARLVSQGGIFFTQHTFTAPHVLHAVTGGRAFSAPATVVAMMQNAIMIQDSREILSGHAMNALRISSVFERRRRWFLPAMMAALLAAFLVCVFSTLRTYYGIGGYNISNTFGTISLPENTFRTAGLMIVSPAQAAQTHYPALGLGAGIMFFMTLMRGHFYWWPIHSLGFLMGASWAAHNLWFSFLLGWLVKVATLKFTGGVILRKLRSFFLGVVIGEAFAIGVTTIVGLLAEVKLGHIFLPT